MENVKQMMTNKPSKSKESKGWGIIKDNQRRNKIFKMQSSINVMTPGKFNLHNKNYKKLSIMLGDELKIKNGKVDYTQSPNGERQL